MIRLAFLLLAGPLAAAPASEPAAHPVVGGLVRSREWLIRRAPRREEEFLGDVSYRSGPDFFQSDWALFRHETQSWQARGQVRMEHLFVSGDRVDVRGQRAEFDQGSGRGQLLPAPGERITFTRRPAAGEPDHGSAGRVDWQGRSLIHLEGGIRVWGPRLDLRGGRGVYASESGELKVSGGRPVLRVLEGDWTGAVQADVVTGRRDPDSLRADGKATGWIRFKDKDKLEKLAQ